MKRSRRWGWSRRARAGRTIAWRGGAPNRPPNAADARPVAVGYSRLGSAGFVHGAWRRCPPPATWWSTATAARPGRGLRLGVRLARGHRPGRGRGLRHPPRARGAAARRHGCRPARYCSALYGASPARRGAAMAAGGSSCSPGTSTGAWAGRTLRSSTRVAEVIPRQTGAQVVGLQEVGEVYGRCRRSTRRGGGRARPACGWPYYAANLARGARRYGNAVLSRLARSPAGALRPHRRPARAAGLPARRPRPGERARGCTSSTSTWASRAGAAAPGRSCSRPTSCATRRSRSRWWWWATSTAGGRARCARCCAARWTTARVPAWGGSSRPTPRAGPVCRLDRVLVGAGLEPRDACAIDTPRGAPGLRPPAALGAPGAAHARARLTLSHDRASRRPAGRPASGPPAVAGGASPLHPGALDA